MSRIRACAREAMHAASLDLVGMLEGHFNDRLSRCLLAIVDEIKEGGAQKYRIATALCLIQHQRVSNCTSSLF